MSKPKEQLLKKHRKNNLDLIKNTITLIIFILILCYLFLCIFIMSKNIIVRFIK
ncbi:hypothetical protein UT300018_23970 [Clostridium faecium]